MIEDKELDEIVENRSNFSEQMELVKQNVLVHASSEDERFVQAVKENIKDAAVKKTEVEQKKADLEKQHVDYESEKLSVQQQETQHKASQDKWLNRQKMREYHFLGVKPIMSFVGVSDPMNLPMLYFLTVLICPFFLISKIFAVTIGNILYGACDSNRPKAVKGFLWTILSIFIVAVILGLIYLFFLWRGIDILNK